jgi:regulator of sigma E protease
VDGQPVKRWQGMSSDSLVWRIITSEGETIAVTYERAGQEATAQVKPEIPATKAYERRGTRQIAVLPAETPLVEKVEAGSAAANAGLQKGDQILEANDQPIYLFDNVPDLARAHPDQPLLLTVERDGQRVKLTAPLQLQGPFIEKAFADGPAARAGLLKGDRVVRVNGQSVFAAVHAIEIVERDGAKPLVLEIEREKQPMKFEVTAEPPVGETKPKLGLQFNEDSLGLALNAYGRRSLVKPPPLEQIRLSAMSIVHTLSAILSPKSDVSAQHLGGPVMMMRIYYLLFESPDGWRQALWFSVLLNVNLALLNLVPLPVLDGGHITLAIFEAIRRRPIEGTFETRALQWIQTGAAMLLIGFMLFITFFDVQDLFGGGRERGMKFAPKEQTK